MSTPKKGDPQIDKNVNESLDHVEAVLDKKSWNNLDAATCSRILTIFSNGIPKATKRLLIRTKQSAGGHKGAKMKKKKRNDEHGMMTLSD